MKTSKFSVAVGALLACLAWNAAAQGTATSSATTAEPKKVEAKKAEPAKAAPKKAAPAKAPPKKPDPKKAPPRKTDDKPHATGQGGTVQKYEAGKAPVLKDSKGNTIPTSPDAYDISSASNPPPKKK